MPLSQAIIGDIIPPRQRGKYQGLMGAVFGVSSVAGPARRWLHHRPLRLALAVLRRRAVRPGRPGRHLQLPAPAAHAPQGGRRRLGHRHPDRRPRPILLATSWGGTTYAWSSDVLGLYALGALSRSHSCSSSAAVEPVIPLRLFRTRCSRSPTSRASRWRWGCSARSSTSRSTPRACSARTRPTRARSCMPLILALIVLSILAGMLITRTGKYKAFMVTGIVLMLGGFVAAHAARLRLVPGAAHDRDDRARSRARAAHAALHARRAERRRSRATSVSPPPPPSSSATSAGRSVSRCSAP